ncbi:mannitol dehydrogenase family protein, partial [Glaciimonas sp. Cout2]|nr:mannitol dehydrogenase family protein [Glaciimonas sp. Cout2]
ITPGPSASVAGELQAAVFGDTEILVTQKHTTTAPFVNTEEVNYLVVEDTFPNGRPPLEKAGVYFTDRDTVNKVERMKVCTCLNPLHTA